MRYLAFVGAVAIGLAPVVTAAPAGATPAAPDLGGYQSVPVEQFVDGAAPGGEVYFQTPDGLLCGIRPAQGIAGCDGALPGAPAEVNEIVLAADLPMRGLRATANPRFVKPWGGAAPVLAAGHKIAFEDFECAVGSDARTPTTLCTKGMPAAHWMVIESSGTGTGIGPRTAGLPADFPDPDNFIVSDQSYLVGVGAKNLFPVFTVSDGLQCKISMFSGGEIDCDSTSSGPLPGRADDEVFVQLPGPVGTRKAGSPPVTAPTYPGPVKELPAGHRIDSFGGTCMAPTDGGVACFGAVGGPPQGFRVSAKDTTTVGGSG
jgi:hypothetical protein